MKAFPLLNMAGQNQQGMDLRDYFAANALHGLLALKETHISIAEENFSEFHIANACYEWADAMMKAREG